MAEPTPEQKREVQRLFLELVQLSEGERSGYLEKSCDDSVVRAQVEQMLAEPRELAGDFLDRPLLEEHALEDLASDFDERPASDPPSHPATLGHYEISGVLGQGGMGIVYEARQRNPRRRVALKVVRAGLFDDRVSRRFEREAQILGRLHHPGIAQIYEAGTTADEAEQPFIAMELVEGVSLGEHVSRRKLDVDQRLELLAQICDAVHHAHTQGVVHRDLKPTNILVDHRGVPKILDFGVARLTDADVQTFSMATATGQIVGTLAYMSPEQVKGKSSQVDARSDVYSLGVILYELLSNQLPYEVSERSIPEVARIIAEEDPRRLSTTHGIFRGDIETIVSKALEKEPQRRYRSAADLASDLRRYLRHEPILARPTSNIYQIRKFAQRHRGLVWGLVATLLALAAGTTLATTFAVREREARHQADARARETQRALEKSERSTYRASLQAAAASLREGNMGEARRVLGTAPDALRGWEWQHFASQLDQSLVVVRHGLLQGGRTDYRFLTLYFTPDGWIHRFPVFGSGAGSFLAWNPGTGEVVAPRTIGEAAAVRQTVSPDGRRIALLDNTMSTLRIEDARTGALLSQTDLEGPVRTLPCPWDPSREIQVVDGFHLLGTSTQRELILHGVAGFRRRNGDPDRFVADGGGVRKLYGFNKGREDAIELWDLSSGSLGVLPPRPDRRATCLFVSPDRRKVAAFSEKRLYLLDREAGEDAAWTESPAGVTCLDFSPDSTLLATGSNAGQLHLWEVETGEQIASMRGHEGLIENVRFSPDGSQLVTSSADRTLRLWEVPRSDALSSDLYELKGHSRYVYPVILSPDGQRIVSGSHHDGVCLWDADTGELITRIFKSGRIWGLAYASDGVRLVVASSEGHYVLNTRSGEISADLGQPPGAGGTADAVLDPTCSRILIADGGPLRSFDEQTLEPAIVVPERTSICAISSAAEPILATSKGASGREIFLWNLASLEKTCVLKGHAAGVTQAAFSADGTRLATASEDGTICVWEVYGSEESLPEGEALLVREPSATLRNHKGRAFAVAWSPDGTRLATGADDRVIRLWETATFQEVAVLSGHRDYVWSLVWSQDGRCLISGSGDTTVRVWESEPERVRISARRERATILQELEPVVLKWFEEWQSAQRVLDRLDQEEGIAGRRREVAEQIILRISVENR